MMSSAKGFQASKGLIIAGTTPCCGKTTFTTGLALSLAEVGVKVLAVKPLSFSADPDDVTDQQFMDRITGQMSGMTSITVPSPLAVTSKHWGKILEMCRQAPYPVLFELPGTEASPLQLAGDSLKDIVDLHRELGYPVLLVNARDRHCIARVRPALTYLESAGVPVVGWVGVGVSEQGAKGWDEQVYWLSHAYDVPFLGTLSFSPSISVERVQQGNLGNLTGAGIDLLPIHQALGVVLMGSK